MSSTNNNDIVKSFNNLKTRKDVARLLEITDKELRFCLFKKKPESFYETFEITKKNGKTRIINAPRDNIKFFQKKIFLILSEVYSPKKCVFGFIKEKNILDNANMHRKKRWILNIDLENFFQQMHFGRVKGVLNNPPYNLSEEAAMTIAQICCYKGYLPQGSSCSPILANMICSSFDTKMIRFSKKYNLYYTRYADDITLSTNTKFISNQIFDINNNKIGKELNEIFLKSNLQINKNKIFLSSNYNRQEVTGLTVNRFPNVRRNYIKQLRSVLYNCQKEGITKTARVAIEKQFCKQYSNNLEIYFLHVLKGKIDYIRQIRGNNSQLFLQFAQKYNNLVNCNSQLKAENTKFKIDENLKINERIDKNIFVIDGVDSFMQGTGFYISKYDGILTCAHCIPTEGVRFDLINQNNKIGNFIYDNNKNYIYSDKTDLDYFLIEKKDIYCCSFDFDNINPFKISKNIETNISKELKYAGFPEYAPNNSPHIVDCKIASQTKYLNTDLIRIDKNISHGASGGIVIDTNDEIFGLIRAGTGTNRDVESTSINGFVPINIIINDIDQKMKKRFK